jgi:hypothetical protein
MAATVGIILFNSRSLPVPKTFFIKYLIMTLLYQKLKFKQPGGSPPTPGPEVIKGEVISGLVGKSGGGNRIRFYDDPDTVAPLL